jgi:hypothetical protein
VSSSPAATPEALGAHLDLRERFFARDVERAAALKEHLVREL